MKDVKVIKYGKVIIAFSITLLVFLVILDAFLVTHENNLYTEEYKARSRNNLALIGTMITEPLLQHKFGIVEQFMLKWGKMNKNILELRAVSPKGLVISKYKSLSSDRKKTLKFSHSVYSMNKHIITLEIVKSSSPIQHRLSRFWEHLILQSILISISLGIILWIIFKKLALKPLETEISKRKQAENNLLKVNDLLEFKVKKRTYKLNATVKRLNNEIENKIQAEHELNKAKNFISNIIDSMPSMLVGVDKNGIITQWNLEAENIIGLSSKEAVGQPLIDVIPRFGNEIDRIHESIKGYNKVVDSRRLLVINGERHYEDITIYPLIANGIEGVVIRIDDVTELVRIEEMMVQSEKMLSIGGLAAGMAHEINNPLAGIIQTAQVLFSRLTDSSLAANTNVSKEVGTTLETIKAYMEKRNIIDLLNRIQESGKRAAKIVNNMLSFARKGSDIFSLHNIPKLIDKCIELSSVDYDLKKKYDFRQIEILREYEENLPEVLCDASKIQQVVMNILKNGTEAMSETERKSVFILRVFYEKDSNFLRIEIEDNGPGMPEDVRKRIFEPFFTTKSVNKGTGLGLSVSYFIITENHKGEMSVHSVQGKGTTFTIKLPVKRKIDTLDNQNLT